VKILHVVGARPNFPKLAPVWRAARERGIEQVVCHTGQHYNEALSGSFFRELELPPPDVNLGVGSGSHAEQTARIMERFDEVLMAQPFSWVVVYGDVNSTVAAALVAAKRGVSVAHVEAGLRSGDRAMPEEINRIVTDRLASLLLTPSHDASARLRAEGEPEEEIVFVGNVMIDSLLATLPRAEQCGFASQRGLDGTHVVVTLHRPSNVDDPDRLARLVEVLGTIAESRRVLFPMHPRTRERVARLGLAMGGVEVIDPVSYVEMLDAVRSAWCVVTDSGGLQEETTALGVPCFTLRDNTERPVTITEGTNVLVRDPGGLAVLVAANAKRADARVPEGWDGRAGVRIVEALLAASGRGVQPSNG